MDRAAAGAPHSTYTFDVGYCCRRPVAADEQVSQVEIEAASYLEAMDIAGCMTASRTGVEMVTSTLRRMTPELGTDGSDVGCGTYAAARTGTSRYLGDASDCAGPDLAHEWIFVKIKRL